MLGEDIDLGKDCDELVKGIKGKEFNDYGRLNDSINLVLQGISDDIKDSALKKYWG